MNQGQHTIFLIGYMGCGKTTLGRALAERCAVEFTDLDDYIEARAGMSIPEIFARQGEGAFRQLERAALEAMADGGGWRVVACGGGTPCFGDNMALMAGIGTTVFLDPPPERLIERLAAARSGRPLIAALSDDELPPFVEAQLAKRLPHYSQAAERFDSSRLEDELQIEATCREFIARFNLPPRP